MGGNEDLITSRFLLSLPAGNGGLTENPSRVLGDVVDSERAHRWASDEPALLAPTLSGSPRQSKSGCVTPKTLRLVRPFACPQSIEKHRVFLLFQQKHLKSVEFSSVFHFGTGYTKPPTINYVAKLVITSGGQVLRFRGLFKNLDKMCCLMYYLGNYRKTHNVFITF